MSDYTKKCLEEMEKLSTTKIDTPDPGKTVKTFLVLAILFTLFATWMVNKTVHKVPEGESHVIVSRLHGNIVKIHNGGDWYLNYVNHIIKIPNKFVCKFDVLAIGRDSVRFRVPGYLIWSLDLKQIQKTHNFGKDLINFEKSVVYPMVMWSIRASATKYTMEEQKEHLKYDTWKLLNNHTNIKERGVQVISLEFGAIKWPWRFPKRYPLNRGKED